MKQKFTRRKEARRASAFRKTRNAHTSAQRMARREKPKPRTYGFMVIGVQAVFTQKRDKFGNPKFKFIKHAAQQRG